MKKFAIAAAVVGALAAGGGWLALGQSEVVAATAKTGRVSDLSISADDKNAITVKVTGGPEGDREVQVAAGQVTKVPSTGGAKYTLTATTADSTEIGDVTVPGGTEEGWDCFASDDYGPLQFGCVIGVG
ncbi:hypothetical protein FKR81_10275 [Lentzea tibetensis]|uniref:Uncharacterized protein n=1 Tax=Lentzea tibetensis TaxID=2591470 RepID=A0A563EY99_9PSEU|nr:hypothetical protein [Lentzea tibetensis]TWP52676.1 hypothetical protein FKR81_10275 [Lentzea tibetensis]